jgi:allantoinase
VTELDLVLRAPRMVAAPGLTAGCVGVLDGRIVAVESYRTDLTGRRTVELGADVVLLPGLVDTHVHINEPGRTDWEGFASATRAAAAGGITTLLDMPLNSVPPTVDVPALTVKRAAAEPQVRVDVGFWGGAVPGNQSELRPLDDAGVFGFKCFLLPSGVPEFPHLPPMDLEKYLRILRPLGVPLVVHAEDETAIERAPRAVGRGYASFLSSRPPDAEIVAVARVIEAARTTGARVHIAHLSSADALPIIAAARREGVPITVETCPHYLVFAAEDIGAGATHFKCCPPIREAENRERLWLGLAAGTIDCVVSDHSPCPVDRKRLDVGDFESAWGGIAGLQTSLSAVWTEARRRGFTITDVVRWMAEHPASFAGLTGKGRIAAGYDADFAVFAPEETWRVEPSALAHRHPVSPYAGRRLDGVVRTTWLRGREIDPNAPHGRLLGRGDRA